MKMKEINVGGRYSNGKSGRYYSERTVLEIEPNPIYPKLSQVLYVVNSGYVSPQLGDDCKGQMCLENFATWAVERLDTPFVQYAETLKFICSCGASLEASFPNGDTVNRVHCTDCPTLWVIPQPYSMPDPEQA